MVRKPLAEGAEPQPEGTLTASKPHAELESSANSQAGKPALQGSEGAADGKISTLDGAQFVNKYDFR